MTFETQALTTIISACHRCSASKQPGAPGGMHAEANASALRKGRSWFVDYSCFRLACSQWAFGEPMYGVKNERFTNGYAQFATCGAEMLARKTATLSYVDGASVPCQQSRHGRCSECAGLKFGRCVLIHVAASSVDRSVAQLAHAAGLTLVPTGFNNVRAELRGLGASQGHRAGDLLLSTKVDALIDLAGGDSKAHLLNSFLPESSMRLRCPGRIRHSRPRTACRQGSCYRQSRPPRWIACEHCSIMANFPLNWDGSVVRRGAARPRCCTPAAKGRVRVCAESSTVGKTMNTDMNGTLVFVRIIETGSFTAAALILRMPKATVSRKIQELEEHLQMQLLHRTTRRLRLTEAGTIYFQCCKQIPKILLEAESAVGQLKARVREALPVTVRTRSQVVACSANRELGIRQGEVASLDDETK